MTESDQAIAEFFLRLLVAGSLIGFVMAVAGWATEITKGKDE